MGLVQGESMAARFFNQLGASLLDRTICSSAGTEGLIHTLGGKVGMRVEFFAESKLILIWGSNSITSNLHFWRLAQEAKRRGARLVCIDPRRTETADKCDEHVQLKPGTDAALALALMHELIVNDWLDHDYLARYTVGWDALRERALRWSPERASEICGVSVEQIRALARDWGTISASGDPPELRHAAGARRGQRGAGGGLSARAHGRLAASGGRCAAVEFGAVSGGSGRPATSRLAGGPQAAHHQHGHHRRRPAATGVTRRSGRPLRRWSSTTAIRWRWRLNRARWSPASRATISSRWCWSISRPTRPTTPTTSCRPPRSWSTGTCTRRTDIPMCC